MGRITVKQTITITRVRRKRIKLKSSENLVKLVKKKGAKSLYEVYQRGKQKAVPKTERRGTGQSTETV